MEQGQWCVHMSNVMYVMCLRAFVLYGDVGLIGVCYVGANGCTFLGGGLKRGSF
jgi:hypothetical protein